MKVVGVGAACVDMQAGVLAFPKPDEKIRTSHFVVSQQQSHFII